MQHNIDIDLQNNNILSKIIHSRLTEINQKGFSQGCTIPQNRQRPVIPFMNSRGVILEIKRASPSKGDINRNLNAADSAALYATSNAVAISVLTETEFFKGSINDLLQASASIDDYARKNNCLPPAILRKDFLFCTEDIDISYRAGADAVLLIARILTKEAIVTMTKKCEELGICALIELRTLDDLEKLQLVCKNSNSRYYVVGINSRDLETFAIDLLQPAQMIKQIKAICPSIRIIFESGIKTQDQVSFVASMGFYGALIGTAAATETKKALRTDIFASAFASAPITQNAQFWIEYSNRRQYKKNPLLKICGLTSSNDAISAFKMGADLLGFIFSDKSIRNTTETVVIESKKQITDLCKKLHRVIPFFVAVITDNSPTNHFTAIAMNLMQNKVVDAIQFHNCVPLLEQKKIPHYMAITLKERKDLQQIDELTAAGECRILLDSKNTDTCAASGGMIKNELIHEASQKTQLWIAGGISGENIKMIASTFKPELIDVCSLIESKPGKKYFTKLVQLQSAFRDNTIGEK